MILLNKINKLCMYVNKTIPNKVCKLKNVNLKNSDVYQKISVFLFSN